MRKKVVLPAVLAISVLVVGILATKKASAQVAYSPIVAKIAQRFNLNVSDVQAVFDEDKQERRAEVFARLSERLDDLVEVGKITPAQKELILDKHEEIRDAIDDLGELSFEERRQKTIQLKDEFRAWMESQNLDLPHALFGCGFGMGSKWSMLNGI